MKKAILVCVAVSVGLLGLWFYGWPAYKRHRETRSIEQAREFMAKTDYRNASLSARQALQMNSCNVEACQMIAELADLSRSPQAINWRRRVAELNPSIENKLMLASTALRLQGPPYPLAAQTLEELASSSKNIAAYHAVSAELALKLKKPVEAVAGLEQANRLDPTNELYQFNLAVLRLQSTNAAAASAAHATLDRLRANPNLGSVALRWLITDSLRQDDLATAQQFSQQLLAGPQAAPGDRLQHLTILRQSNSPEFTSFLGVTQKNAQTNASEIYGLSAWMISQNLVDEALVWLTNCPVKIRAEQPVPLAIVDCYLTKKDWGRLDTFLQEQKKWADRECLRLAFLSLAAAELKQNLAAEARWRAAVREAGERLGPLTALLAMAESWKREKAQEDLLWLIAQRFPGERWTLRELNRIYLANGNTYGLNKLYSATAGYDSKNYVAQNNLAATSFLLKLNLPRAHELAKEVFTQHPEEPIVASTYAYSLHLQGRTQEGLAVLTKQKTEALEIPSVALYYGLLLSASGETNKADKYLGIAAQSKLLPEEKALLTNATRRAPGS